MSSTTMMMVASSVGRRHRPKFDMRCWRRRRADTLRSLHTRAVADHGPGDTSALEDGTNRMGLHLA